MTPPDNPSIRTLADCLGFEATPDGLVPSIPRSEVEPELAWNFKPIDKSRENGLEGIYQGKKIHVAEFVSGAGKYSMSWGEMAVAVDAGGFYFSLRHKTFDQKLLKLVCDTSIKTGDEAFDHVWEIETSNEAAIRAILGPDLLQKIKETALGRGAVFILENNWLRGKEPGGLSSVSWGGAPAGMLEMMVYFAEAVDVAVEKFPSSRVKRDGYGEVAGGYDDKKDDDWGEVSPDYDRSP